MDGRRRWLARWSWPFWVALAAAVALAFLDDSAASDLSAAAMQVVLNLIVALLAWRAGARLDGRTRLAWRVIALACVSLIFAALGIVLWSLLGHGLPGEDGLWWLVALVNGLAFLGLLLLSPPEIRGASAVRFSLDGLIVGVAILFMLLASVEQWQPGSPGAELTVLAYPAIDAAALTVILLVGARRSGHVPLWYALVAASFLIVLATDALTAAAPQLPWIVSDAGYYLQLGLIGSAALLAGRWPATTASPERLAAQWAVYVPFALSVGAAMYDYLENDGLVAPLFFMAVLAVSLVVTRTILVLGENDRLARELRESASFKTQLLRFISHEVANPLSPLRLQMHMLREGHAKDPDRAWATIERSVHRLESLSSDVRMMALAETQRLVRDTTPTDLAPRMLAAVAAHQALAEKKGLHLVADVSAVTVPVQAERLDQVVDNLLSNALKFTPRGGTVTLRLRPSNGGAVLEVTDTGAGLTDQQREQLFTAFGRAHGDAQPGLGLGLYLCKAIIDGHGGRILALSDGPGKGATFRVELPAAPRTADPALPPRPQYPPNGEGAVALPPAAPKPPPPAQQP